MCVCVCVCVSASASTSASASVSVSVRTSASASAIASAGAGASVSVSAGAGVSVSVSACESVSVSVSTNHCLWTYSKATRVRQSLPRTCLSWSNSQKRAYYGLIYPNTVLNKVNMTPCFRHGSVDIDTDDWLESVTLI